MVSAMEIPARWYFNALACQTCLTARIERKGLSRPLSKPDRPRKDFPARDIYFRASPCARATAPRPDTTCTDPSHHRPCLEAVRASPKRRPRKRDQRLRGQCGHQNAADYTISIWEVETPAVSRRHAGRKAGKSQMAQRRTSENDELAAKIAAMACSSDTCARQRQRNARKARHTSAARHVIASRPGWVL